MDKATDGVYRVKEDDNASITCRVDANPVATEVEWKKDGNTAQSGEKLSINKMKRAQAGSYVCQATNKRGVGEDDVTVDVLYKPSINLNATYVFKEGDSAEVQCDVDANPEPFKTQWFKGGVPLSPLGPWLNFSSVSRDDGGTYSCVSTNSQEPTGSDKVHESESSESTKVKIVIYSNLPLK